jgi:hypothetical protein
MCVCLSRSRNEPHLALEHFRPGAVHFGTSFLSQSKRGVCLFVCSSQTFADCGQGSGMKELYVHPSVFLSLFLSFCLSVRPSVSPSVHPSFFSSLTSPSSLAPFSVSLIYIFLISFLGSHVIGLFSMCSNVHTIAYMQLLDFLYCQFCT